MEKIVINQKNQRFIYIADKKEAYGEFVYLKNIKTSEVHLFSKRIYENNFTEKKIAI